MAQRVVNRMWRDLGLRAEELDLDLVTMPECAARAGMTRQASCDHNTYVHTDPHRGRIKSTKGRMPLHLLESLFREFVNKPWKGVKQIFWAPGVSETVYDPNPR